MIPTFQVLTFDYLAQVHTREEGNEQLYLCYNLLNYICVYK